MMYLPFNGNSLLLVMREIRRPATLAELSFRMSMKFPHLPQDAIIDGVATLLRVGWLNTMIVQQGERYWLSESMYSVQVHDVPPPTPRLLTIALGNVSIMELMSALPELPQTQFPIQEQVPPDEISSNWDSNGMQYEYQYVEQGDITSMASHHSTTTFVISSTADASEELYDVNADYAAAEEELEQEPEEEILTEPELESEHYMDDGESLLSLS